MAGKNINYYLLDGTPNGRIKCTLANWTGVVYRIPHTDLDKCKEREDLKQSGVYFLFGTEEETEQNVVYIGQAGIRKNGEGILYRLKEHKRNADKYYWTEAVVFTTSNNSFGQTEISWLENRFCTLAQDAKRYVIKNNNDPNSGHVTEEKESELEEFIGHAKVVMGVLGYKIFEPLIKTIPQTNPETNDSEEIIEDGLLLYINRNHKRSGREIAATCVRTSEGFVIKKGSSIELQETTGIPANVQKRRQSAKIDDDGILQEDVLFKNPSPAASFVVGSSVSGLKSWKLADGRTLSEIENQD